MHFRAKLVKYKPERKKVIEIDKIRILGPTYTGVIEKIISRTCKCEPH